MWKPFDSGCDCQSVPNISPPLLPLLAFTQFCRSVHNLLLSTVINSCRCCRVVVAVADVHCSHPCVGVWKFSTFSVYFLLYFGCGKIGRECSLWLSCCCIFFSFFHLPQKINIKMLFILLHLCRCHSLLEGIVCIAITYRILWRLIAHWKVLILLVVVVGSGYGVEFTFQIKLSC